MSQTPRGRDSSSGLLFRESSPISASIRNGTIVRSLHHGDQERSGGIDRENCEESRLPAEKTALASACRPAGCPPRNGTRFSRFRVNRERSYLAWDQLAVVSHALIHGIQIAPVRVHREPGGVGPLGRQFRRGELASAASMRET
jgi:hypothetical protein